MGYLHTFPWIWGNAWAMRYANAFPRIGRNAWAMGDYHGIRRQQMTTGSARTRAGTDIPGESREQREGRDIRDFVFKKVAHVEKTPSSQSEFDP
jgi:hypothetical protein